MKVGLFDEKSDCFDEIFTIVYCQAQLDVFVMILSQWIIMIVMLILLNNSLHKTPILKIPGEVPWPLKMASVI